jgi:uroporphyrin-III C-methyltransferase/precorrin-2 dehydrogenase/sirohydrochlorin ferrochelatase/uroporphyrin-III C-methyltransferase
LLTVKSQRLRRGADVLVYDRLVSAEILDLIPPGTTHIYLGKAKARHHMPLDETNDLLCAWPAPATGWRPTTRAGINSGLGIPLTHRSLSTSVRFVTVHCRDDAELDLDWQGLANPNSTLVFYMGLSNLEQIVA